MVAFFPWFTLAGPIDLGPLTLLPYWRGREPAGPPSTRPDAALQRRLDALFDHYFPPFAQRPLNLATVVRVSGHDVTDDLGEEEREEVFAIAELIAFGGLAAREFFGPLGFGPYCNAHTFRPYIQSFPDVPGGADTSVRRRDGSVRTYLTDDANREYAPRHVSVSVQQNVPLDVPLIRALIAMKCWRRDPRHRDRVEEAIEGFNAANTDSDYTHEHTEAVLMVGAFARALGVNGARMEGPLAQAVKETLRPVSERMADDAQRGLPADVANLTSASGDGVVSPLSVREAWIRDFVRVRHQPAHGHLTPSGNAWPLREHLLLGAYAFPLVVKVLLSRPRLATYNLTAAEREAIELFEALASVDAFAAPEREDPDQQRLVPWERVRLERIRARARQAAIALARGHDEPPA